MNKQHVYKGTQLNSNVLQPGYQTEFFYMVFSLQDLDILVTIRDYGSKLLKIHSMLSNTILNKFNLKITLCYAQRLINNVRAFQNRSNSFISRGLLKNSQTVYNYLLELINDFKYSMHASCIIIIRRLKGEKTDAKKFANF